MIYRLRAAIVALIVVLFVTLLGGCVQEPPPDLGENGKAAADEETGADALQTEPEVALESLEQSLSEQDSDAELEESAEKSRSSAQDDAQRSYGSKSAASDASAGRERNATAQREQPAADSDGITENAVPSAAAPNAAAHDAASEAAAGDAAAGAVQPRIVAEPETLSLEDIERELLRLVNEERVRVSVEPLGEQSDMLFAARIRAGEIQSNFSHTRPNGDSYYTAFEEAGFSYAGKWHGENLAVVEFSGMSMSSVQAAGELYALLHNSPGHYKNMVSDNFYQAGMGVTIVVTDGTTKITAAQLFASF